MPWPPKGAERYRKITHDALQRIVRPDLTVVLVWKRIVRQRLLNPLTNLLSGRTQLHRLQLGGRRVGFVSCGRQVFLGMNGFQHRRDALALALRDDRKDIAIKVNDTSLPPSFGIVLFDGFGLR